MSNLDQYTRNIKCHKCGADIPLSVAELKTAKEITCKVCGYSAPLKVNGLENIEKLESGIDSIGDAFDALKKRVGDGT
jgi:transcription elongation factor Elf1